MAALKTQSAPAVQRSLSILEKLANSRQGLTLPELSRQLALPKSTAHCLLVTLERRGYLHRNENTKRYMFGLKLLGLANMALTRLEVREQALSFLQALMEQTGLTVHMMTLEQNEAVLIAKVEPPTLLKVATWLGMRVDLHCTGVGKALIAYLPEGEFDRLIKKRGLPRYNPNTISSLRKLKEDLSQVRTLGYSFDNEEHEIGLRCIGAPIFDHKGAVIASISVTGTSAQITLQNLPVVAEKVTRTATAISRQLGFVPEAARSESDFVNSRCLT